MAHAIDPNTRPMADGLSQRERQIVDMAINGLTDQAIANRLGISRATVTTYWSRIRTKFGPLGRTELVANYVQELADNSAEELAASESLFRSFCECAPIGIYLLDREFACVYVNPAWCEMTGQSADQSRGIGWQTVIHPEDLPRVIGQREAVTVDLSKLRIRRRGGGSVWVRIRRVQRRVAGGIAGYIGIVENISAEVASSRAKEESESKFQSLVQAVPELVWIASADKRFIEVNAWAERYLGLKPESLLDRGWIAALHPDDVLPSIRAWRAAEGEKRPYEAKIRLRRHDGQFRWNVSRAVPTLDDSGGIRYWIGTTMDVHDYRNSDSAAFGIFEQLADFVCIQDLDGAVRFASPSSTAVLGCSPEEMNGAGLDFIARHMHPVDFEDVRRQMPRLAELSDGGVIEKQFRWIKPGGEMRWLRARTSPFSRDDEQAVTQVLTVIEDMTEEHSQQERSELSLQQLNTEVAELRSELAASRCDISRARRDLQEIASALETESVFLDAELTQLGAEAPLLDLRIPKLSNCAQWLGKQPKVAKFDVAETARRIWAAVPCGDRSGRIEAPDSLLIRGDSAMIAFVLQVLICEALVAMRNLRAPRVVIEPLKGKPSEGFVLKDARLTSPGCCEPPHISFGLEHYTAHRIVEAHGGRLWREVRAEGGCQTIVDLNCGEGVRKTPDLEADSR